MMTGWDDVAALLVVAAAFVILCLKGCSIERTYQQNVTMEAFKKGYIQKTIPGSASIIWTKDAPVLPTTN